MYDRYSQFVHLGPDLPRRRLVQHRREQHLQKALWLLLQVPRLALW